MSPAEVHNTYKKILVYLTEERLKNAFEKTELLSSELQSTQYQQNLENLQTSYQLLLQYFMNGVKDPERKQIYNKLIANIFVTAAELRDELLTRDSVNFEFVQKRYFPYTPQMTDEELKNKLDRKGKLEELKELLPVNSDKEFQIEIEFENAVRYLFNYFWLKSTYDSTGIMEIYHEVMNDSFEDSVAKSMIVSAITLNLWRTFNENKLLMLLDACNSSDLATRQRALIGICFILAKYNPFLPYFPSIRNRLVLLADDNFIIENLQNIIIQIIGTTETDQISKKLNEEIFPELMKLRPKMDENFMNMDEWGEINPDWQDMIDESGVSDKIEELAEMEKNGADVYMSTFSMLKSFPFFNEFSNWFLPFDTEHSAIRSLFTNEDKSLFKSVLNSDIMCNSDRYSFTLSILQMPVMQRNMIKNSFGEAAEKMDEMSKDETIVSSTDRAKVISRHYIQDLFRFFKLNPNRNDFANMFQIALVMHKTYLFDILSIDNEIKKNIADFYFSKKLYPQALELFSELEKELDTSAELYQKMGYAYQQTSQLKQALEAYKKADLIQPDDFWTNRKIALCYRLLGDTENSLNAYRHADFIKPNDVSVQLQIVFCLEELKRYDEALKDLASLNNENPDNPKIMRATMSVAFTNRNLSQAYYFSSVLLEKEQASANDFMVGGHISWCMQKGNEAKDRYKKALNLLNNDWNQFVVMFKQDQQLLISNGVNEDEIPLILDAISYCQSSTSVSI